MSTTPDDVAWALRGHRSAPADALRRIEALYADHDELYAAMPVILATHLGSRREHLAAAIKRFRRDTQALSECDG